MNYKIISATKEQVESVGHKIENFNARALDIKGTVEYEKHYIALDDDEKMIAGIMGYIYLEEVLYVHILFVDEMHRYKGLGQRLLQTLEQDAKSAGVKLIHLDTFDFQAKDFYLKYGYEVFGILDNCPTGHKRYYMKKVCA